MFWTVPLSVISFSLYTQRWHMSHMCADSLRAGSVWNSFHPDPAHKLSANLYDIYHRCVQWKTPDDGQRKCPKHLEFHSKNKFEKSVHLVGFIIRNLSWCTVTWTSNATLTAAPTSSANRSGSEPSGISQVAGVYSVVLSNPRVSYQILERRVSTATVTKSWQRRTHTNRRTKPPAKTFHQWLVWYCSWLSKRMNVFPASLTGPVYMNILDSHYQNCWRMCHTPWESSSFIMDEQKKKTTVFPALWSFLLACLLICPKSPWLFHLGTPQMSLLRDSNRTKWLSSTQDPGSRSSMWQHTMNTGSASVTAYCGLL